MIRNYNGKVNRAILRDLRELCDVNDGNLLNFLEAFAKNGEVSFYTNLCPFTGCPDEMSDTHTLTSEEEIREYLKKNAEGRLEEYLQSIEHKNPTADHLMAAVVEFIKENAKYPNKDEMRQLEIVAEAKRIAELPAGTVTQEMPQTDQDMMREIMELAEEIFESRQLTDPKDIHRHAEPYEDELFVESGDFDGSIRWDRHYGNGDSCDYSLVGDLSDNGDIIIVRFRPYYGDDVLKVRVYAQHYWYRDREINLSTDHLITVHKSIVDLAEQEGIEFISEIDYEKLVPTPWEK